MPKKAEKNYYAAIILTILFGGFGIHKFYLRKPLQGLAYMLFFWTFLPSVFAVIDFIILVVNGEEEFNLKYNA